MFSPDQSLSDLALAHPPASRVFRLHRLDFCCGGQQSLRDACEARGLDVNRVLDELNQEPEQRLARDVRTIPLPELVDYIIVHFHQAHRVELADLTLLARKVERVHAQKPEVPVGLASHLEQMADNLEQHMLKEEAVLFPAIVRGARRALAVPIEVMTCEHVEHGNALERMRRLAFDFVAPEHACTSWRALYLRCAELENELMSHVHLENSVLFPRVLAGEP
ncbi:MAG TPA: iron-sulfur cluster repair protein YtfE [Polyangiaceae bacterium]|nr:iron-sulfur cluster repair protein YtfE [Polyangiaceae bacterium]